MRIDNRKTFAVCAFFIGTLYLQTASAAYETLDIQWSGAQYGNSAFASGFITFNDALLPQTGNTGFVALPDASISALNITIQGASSGNGSFNLLDFSGVSFSTPSPLDFSKQLIGQSLSTGKTFGSLVNDGSAGDFNLFGQTASAPYGISNFTLETSQGNGDVLSVTSISAAPEPAIWLFMLIGFPLVKFCAERKNRSYLART